MVGFGGYFDHQGDYMQAYGKKKTFGYARDALVSWCRCCTTKNAIELCTKYREWAEQKAEDIILEGCNARDI